MHWLPVAFKERINSAELHGARSFREQEVNVGLVWGGIGQAWAWVIPAAVSKRSWYHHNRRLISEGGGGRELHCPKIALFPPSALFPVGYGWGGSLYRASRLPGLVVLIAVLCEIMIKRLSVAMAEWVKYEREIKANHFCSIRNYHSHSVKYHPAPAHALGSITLWMLSELLFFLAFLVEQLQSARQRQCFAHSLLGVIESCMYVLWVLQSVH